MTEASDPETGFLEQLGQRVRTMRALRGMSRKVLAKVSGISERYSAQLESGAVTLEAASAVKAQAQVIDLDASQALRENAGGVGHTYTGAQVHYWVPMEGTSNWPVPPLHPMEGSDSLVGDP